MVIGSDWTVGGVKSVTLFWLGDPCNLIPELSGTTLDYDAVRLWVELEDTFITTHIGGYANINISYLISRDFKLSVDFGYKHWIGIWDALLTRITGSTSSYGGIMLAGGVTFKL